MRTPPRLSSCFPTRQGCYSGAITGSVHRLQRGGAHNSRLPPSWPWSIYARQLHIFPSPFHRRSQDSDLSSAARPPPHIPLPPPVSANRQLEHFSLNSNVPQFGQQNLECSGSEDQAGSPVGVAQIIKTHVTAQRWMHQRIWAALTQKQWPLFETLMSNYWKCGLKYDEVTYTLKLHGYILCHRQKPEKAYLVIEEMKAAEMHPAIIRLNEGTVISQMELQDIFCALPADAYQNLCKLAFNAAIKVQRQRRIRLRERLLAASPQKLFAMTYRDVLALLDEQEKALCFPDEALSLIAAGDATNSPASKENAALLKFYGEALGIEEQRDCAGLLEEVQPNMLIADLP